MQFYAHAFETVRDVNGKLLKEWAVGSKLHGLELAYFASKQDAINYAHEVNDKLAAAGGT